MDPTARNAMNALEMGGEEGLLLAGQIVLRLARALAPPEPPADEDPDTAVSLRESGHVEIEPGGRTVRVEFNTPYAAKIHEALHYKHPRGGQAKYLEHALQQVLPQLENIMAAEVRTLMVTGGKGHANRRRARARAARNPGSA